jgi:hypothetical protein
MRLSRIQFLQEADSVMDHFTVTFELNGEYSGDEIGHFRAFALLFLKEAMHGTAGLVFGSTDNNGRLDAATPEQLATSPEAGIRAGICGRQWERRFPQVAPGGDESSTVADDTVGVPDLEYDCTGSFTAVGLDRVKSLSINYRQGGLIRLRPGIQLQHLNNSMFIFSMNQTMAERVKTIHIYANEYKLAEISVDGFWIDQSAFDSAIPLPFNDSELADSWVRLRPRGESVFHVRFSEQTPKRFFHAREITDSQSR